jgi:multisubunit Na+/H+ antiporter MnhC subunit
MIRALATLVILVFTVGAILMVAGPLYEGVAPTIQEDDAVQEMGHADTIDSIVKAALVYAPTVLVMGMTGWAFVWVLRRERFFGRAR